MQAIAVCKYILESKVEFHVLRRAGISAPLTAGLRGSVDARSDAGDEENTFPMATPTAATMEASSAQFHWLALVARATRPH